MIEKGQKVSVAGGVKTIICIVADVDTAKDILWIRLPTGNMLRLNMNKKSGCYEGRIAGLDLYIDPSEN